MHPATNFIGQVEIRESQGDAISVSVRVNNPDYAGPDIRQAGGRVDIDGGQSMRGLNCQNRNNVLRVGRRFGGRVEITEYPVLIIEAPASLAFSIDDSTYFGEAGLR